ncbi:MAG: hypothetical protein HC923_12655 [Myxococcales bacterium]|nr:hypothetical protein [Myxococcales bacterium]
MEGAVDQKLEAVYTKIGSVEDAIDAATETAERAHNAVAARALTRK